MRKNAREALLSNQNPKVGSSPRPYKNRRGGYPPIAKTRDDPKKCFKINEKIWKNPRIRAVMPMMNPRTAFRISAAWDHPASYLDEPKTGVKCWIGRTWHGHPFRGTMPGSGREYLRAGKPCHPEPNKVQQSRFGATNLLSKRNQRTI